MKSIKYLIFTAMLFCLTFVTYKVSADETPVLTGTANTIQIANTAEALTNQDLIDAITWQDDNYSTEELEFYIYDNTYKQTKIVGRYSYKVRATNPDNVECVVLNYVEVIDKLAPTIEGPDTITAGYKMSDAEIIAMFSMKDETAIGSIRITSSNLVDAIGTYTIVITAYDAAGNTSSKAIQYIYKDQVSPVAAVRELYINNDSTPFTENDLLDVITWTDNYDQQSTLVVTILNNEYNQTTIVGRYAYQEKCVDAAGNTSITTNYVNVIDNIKPTIEGPSELAAGHLLSNSEILSQFKLNDETSIGELVVASNNAKASQGLYTIVLRGNDAAGNVITKEVTFKFIGLDSNIVISDGVVCVAKRTDALPAQEIRNMIGYMLNIVIDETWTVSYNSDYLTNYSHEGSYSFQAKVTTPEGEVYENQFIVKVYNPVVIKEAKKKTPWYKKIINAIKKVIKLIIKLIIKFIKWFCRFLKRIWEAIF